MTRILLGVATLLAVLSTPLLGQPPAATTNGDTTSGDALSKLDLEWAEAYKQHDRAALGRILADDFIFTDDAGRVFDKTQYIDLAAQDEGATYRIDDVRARTYGDSGVVTGQWADKDETLRFTDVFVKHDGHWQAVASQETRIKKK